MIVSNLCEAIRERHVQVIPEAHGGIVLVVQDQGRTRQEIADMSWGAYSSVKARWLGS